MRSLGSAASRLLCRPYNNTVHTKCDLQYDYEESFTFAASNCCIIEGATHRDARVLAEERTGLQYVGGVCRVVVRDGRVIVSFDQL